MRPKEKDALKRERWSERQRKRDIDKAKEREREREKQTVELSNLGVPRASTAKGTKP